MGMGNFLHLLARRQVLEETETIIGSADSWKDLSSLGVNSVFGLAFYTVLGYLTVFTAGPAAVIAIGVAALAAVLSGLSYAEFGARTRREGSSYLYTYVCLGELLAFLVGWTCILRTITSIAGLARAFTYVVDFMANDKLITFYENVCRFHWSTAYLSDYIDFLALLLPFVLAILLLTPLPHCQKLNRTFAIINIILSTVVLVLTAIRGKPENWGSHHGGFFPFGYEGVLNALPLAVCALMSVEYMSMTRTHAVHQVQEGAIVSPMVLSVLTLCIWSTAICLASTLALAPVDTLYGYEPVNVLLSIFESFKSVWEKWFVAVSSLISICGSLYLIMNGLPKLLYTMAADSLLFRCWGRDADIYKPPIFGTIFMAAITGLFGAFLSTLMLLKLLAIGILITYTCVTISALILRYTDGRIQKGEYLHSEIKSNSVTNLVVCENRVTFGDYCRQWFNTNQVRAPTATTSFLVKINVALFCIGCIAINLTLHYGTEALKQYEIWIFVTLGVILLLIILILISIAVQPLDTRKLSFKVPCVPIVPAISIFLNIFIMSRLEYEIWIAFAIWIVLGLCIYFICLVLYERFDTRTTISLSRETLNGKMKYAYDNEVYLEETSSLPPGENPISNGHLQITDLDDESITDSFASTVGDVEDSEEVVGGGDDDNHVVYIVEELPDEENDQKTNDEKNVTSAIAMLDEVLSSEETTDDTIEASRKISIETIESKLSLEDTFEHMAQIHQEDTEDVTQPADNNFIPEAPKLPTHILYESEINDKVSDIRVSITTMSAPRTPTVSRTSSSVRPISRADDDDEDVDQFGSKLNQLLQKHLDDKPGQYKTGFYKPRETLEREESFSAEQDLILVEIQRKLRARKLKNESPVNATEDEVATTTGVVIENEDNKTLNRKDIRQRLEEILQMGPHSPMDVQRTIRRQNTRDDDKPSIDDVVTNDEDPNKVSTVAQEIRKVRMSLSPKMDSGIESSESGTTSSNEELQSEEKRGDIREKLTQILQNGPQRQSQQFAVKKHYSAPSYLSKIDFTAVDINCNEDKSGSNSNVDPKSMHQTLMRNTLRSIRSRGDGGSSRGDGSFLDALKQQEMVNGNTDEK